MRPAIAAIIILLSALGARAAEKQNKEGGILPEQATPLQPAGSMHATLPGSAASLGYRPGRFTPVPDLTTSSGQSLAELVAEGER
jgi:hypothetical protein